MYEIYNSEEYYKQYKSYFFKIIKDFKQANPTQKYKELKDSSHAYQLIYSIDRGIKFTNVYVFSEIEFLLFKFYYLLKAKNDNFDSFISLFDNFTLFMKNDYIKYIGIFYIILKKYPAEFKFDADFKDMFYMILECNYITYNNYKLYLEYLENLFFYNFFFISDFKIMIIDNIIYGISKHIKDRKIQNQYMQPLESILSWSIMREIWIYLCIIAKPKKYNI